MWSKAFGPGLSAGNANREIKKKLNKKEKDSGHCSKQSWYQYLLEEIICCGKITISLQLLFILKSASVVLKLCSTSFSYSGHNYLSRDIRYASFISNKREDINFSSLGRNTTEAIGNHYNVKAPTLFPAHV